jgi:O-antigen/teichoic acid export membrane protein
MGLGLALVAEPFILTFFTDKWIDAVPVVRSIAIYATLLSVVHNTTSVYWAEGRPQISTWVGLVRLSMLFPALLWAVLVTRSIVVVGWIHAGMAFISAVLNFVIASRLIGLSIAEIVRALRPGVLAGLFMAYAVFISMKITQPFLTPWLLLLVNVLVGGVVYLVSLWFLQRDIVLAVISKTRSAVGWD